MGTAKGKSRAALGPAGKEKALRRLPEDFTVKRPVAPITATLKEENKDKSRALDPKQPGTA